MLVTALATSALILKGLSPICNPKSLIPCEPRVLEPLVTKEIELEILQPLSLQQEFELIRERYKFEGGASTGGGDASLPTPNYQYSCVITQASSIDNSLQKKGFIAQGLPAANTFQSSGLIINIHTFQHLDPETDERSNFTSLFLKTEKAISFTRYSFDQKTIVADLIDGQNTLTVSCRKDF